MNAVQRRMPFAASAEGDRPQNWATPLDLFQEIERRYAHGGAFDLDVCAESWSAKCRTFFSDSPPAAWRSDVVLRANLDLGDAFDRESWSLATYGGPPCPSCFCNPPFDDIGAWMARARHEVERGHVSQVVFLVPARMGRAWWTEHVPHAAFVRPVRGRINFDAPPGAKSSGGFEDCVVVAFEAPLPAQPGKATP